jgi:hypothetical protein
MPEEKIHSSGSNLKIKLVLAMPNLKKESDPGLAI